MPVDIHSLTQQPFGETERLAGSDHLGDVPNLDLNEKPQGGQQNRSDENDNHSKTAHTSVFGSAASLLPSIPFMSSRASASTEATNEIVTDNVEARHRRHKSQPPAISDPSTSTTSTMKEEPIVSDLSDLSSDLRSAQLLVDRTKPEIVARDDMVLDMSGYHSDDRSGSASNGRSSFEVRTSVLDTFARDLLAAIPNEKRPIMTLRSTDPNLLNTHISLEPEEAVEDSSGDDDEEPESRRFDRAKSEPPIEPPNPVSPTLDPTKAAMAMDYAWDWGRVPPEGHREQTHHVPERRESMPPIETDPTTAPSARLRNVEENPYLFVFDSEGRSHTFELSLSEISVGDNESRSESARQSTFLDHRITFQKFIESPQIVDDPRLVVRYSLQ
jgi:phosphatidate phosphatase LPIN